MGEKPKNLGILFTPAQRNRGMKLADGPMFKKCPMVIQLFTDIFPLLSKNQFESILEKVI